MLLFATAVFVRCWRWPLVFHGDEVRLFGNDAYYHARRVFYSIENFPAFLGRDPYVAFPEGGEPIWPPLVDFAMAALARLTLDRENVGGVEALMAWTAPVVGACCVLALYGFARRAFGAGVARLAAGSLALLPAHAHYSQLGFYDHHAFVALLSVWLAWSTWRVCSLSGAGLTRGALLGALMALALGVWPGALMHVVLCEAALWFACATERDPGAARLRARAAAVAQIAAALVIAPLSLGNDWERWGAWSPLVLSNFQPAFFLLSLVCFGAVALASLRRQRQLQVLLGTALVALSSVAWLPGVSDGFADAWAWITRDESFQALVAESFPLFSISDASFERVARSLGLAFFAAPLLMWAIWRERSRDPVAVLVSLVWLLAMFAAALAQRRFVNVLAPPLMLCLAAAVVFAGRRIVE